MLSVLNETNVEVLRTKELSSSEWMEISDRLDIPFLKLKTHWYMRLYSQLFSEKPVDTRILKLKMIKK